MPSLKLMRIGVFGSMIKIRVRLPAGHIPQPPSSFHPGAQLPAYLVNPPADTTAPSYYYGTLA
ncbi:hypothetical protein K474DRAFT_1706562 [Panus rudis PR-1116 ss-1]|nr:hypothetical protein K474DRAFT_1706562 [Panus rudis PR-1116 ss-1]